MEKQQDKEDKTDNIQEEQKNEQTDKKVVTEYEEQENPSTIKDPQETSVELPEDEQAALKATQKQQEEGLGEHEGSLLKTEKEKKQLSVENFDWDAYTAKGFGQGYTDEERNELIDIYSQAKSVNINQGEVVQGKVLSINNQDVILDVGFKSDGLVSLAEFKDFSSSLKIGDTVDLFVESREDAEGRLVLSRRKAKLMSSWNSIEESFEKDIVVEGFVKRRTKGGLIVDVFGIEAFLPGSQIDVKPIRDFDIYVNQSIEVKIIKINYANDNVVVSHKILIEKDLETQKSAILSNLEKGQVLEGIIKNITSFGVFIDLGGVDGLLHITDISWERITHPEEVLKLDQVVKVVVLEFDEGKKRISLGMKQLSPHPWESLSPDVVEGSHVTGKIVNVADYGAFLEIQRGVEGLIHVSEMSWSQHLRSPQDFIKVGDECKAVVLTIDREEHKMSLGIKQLTEDPWTREDTLTKYAVGTRHVGIVRNHTNFGLFLELEEGINGLVHVSDLSWTKKIKNPSEFLKVGESLEVQVLELDSPNRKLSLSHKHLEENPWDTFEQLFEVGSIHKSTIIHKTDKGVVLELPYGIEGFCSNKNLIREEDKKIETGESFDFKVIEFSKHDRRIVLTMRVDGPSPEEKKPLTRKQQMKNKSKNIERINKETEKSTLGDIEALTTLKSRFGQEEKAKKESDKKKKDNK